MGVSQFIFLMVVVFQGAFSSLSLSFNHSCRHDQSLALLRFKQAFTINKSASYDLYYDCGRNSTTHSTTSFWNGSSDCCKWKGVSCDQSTGYVIELDLNCGFLQGSLHSNSTLFELSHLRRLYLSGNDFYLSQISPKFGNLTNLTHLRLSSSGFQGVIPSEISYLSKLVYLALGGYSSRQNGLRFPLENFKLLLQNLTRLQSLELQSINISSVMPMNFSSSLESIWLINTSLQGKLPETIFELPYLSSLRLEANQDLNTHLPKFNSSSLFEIYFSGTSFVGELPDSIGAMNSLTDLYLSECGLEGPIPKSIGNLTNMSYLSLGSNNLIGTIPSSLFNLLYLVYIDLSQNNLEGPIPNSFTNVTRFPNLVNIVLTNNSLSGTIPSWIFSLPSLGSLNLASNRFTGHLEDFKTDSLEFLELNNNELQGFVPQSISKQINLFILNLRSNFFQGRAPIPLPNISLPHISYFMISNNKFTGEIPADICNLSSLYVLDASYNQLSGVIPPCLGNFSINLMVLDMRMNNFSGAISTIFSRDNQLTTLNLNGNHLKGPIPRSLIHCRQLELLDLGNNELSGAFPLWLQTLPQLQVLVLRANKFHGSIGNFKSERSFNMLRIMDLSHNNFTGHLQRKNFERLKGMMSGSGKQERLKYMGDNYYNFGNSYQDSVIVSMKGIEIVLLKILTNFITIDLSSNNFNGEIPSIIGNFNALKGLNLSHNRFTGRIPPSLGKLSNLEWLDLSTNKLVGRIPEELTSLTFLEVLNLSSNHLVGRIPRGKQFDTFPNDSYGENSGLCGFPLTKGCGYDKVPHQAQNTNLETDDDSGFESGFGWKVVLLGYACGFAFSLIVGNLLLYIGKPKWFANIVKREEHRWINKSRKRSRGSYNRRRN